MVIEATLAVVLHDPENRFHDQLQRTFPTLTAIFPQIVARTSYSTHATTIRQMTEMGVMITRPSSDGNTPQIGQNRRDVITLALQTSASHILYCDFDRVLHWADCYPDELGQIAHAITAYDFTILGRTLRAFDSHPRIQRDTERIINHVYALVAKDSWDVTTGARGLSRRAAEAILAGCPDQEISNDVTWPLFLKQTGGFDLGYLETEGLEFETADRYATEIVAAGGYEHWLTQLDTDPQQWAFRLQLALLDVEAMLPFS